MIALAVLSALGVGYFFGWLQWADRAGTYHIPDDIHERSGWIHDGTLYVAERETDRAVATERPPR